MGAGRGEGGGGAAGRGGGEGAAGAAWRARGMRACRGRESPERLLRDTAASERG